MLKKSTIAIALVATLSCTATPREQPTPPVAATVTPSASLRPPSDAPPIRDNPAGPYAVAIESDSRLPTHTIYRPADLTAFEGKTRLPIVSWGNGACANVGLLFKTFLSQVASHGYIVISIGPKDAPLPAFASGGRTPESTPRVDTPAAPPGFFTRDAQLLDAIDWALSENARRGSAYYDRLDPERIAVMGQSCGGLQAIAVSSDPRVKTSVIWNSGVFPEGANPVGARLSGATKQSLAAFHAPVAYFIGGPSDIAYKNAEDDFARIGGVPAFKANLNVGHGGTYAHPGAGWFGEVGVAWLDWQLKGDARASRYFEGPDCTLCTSPIWKVEKKNLR